MSARRGYRVLVLVVAGVAVSACAAIPTSGRVQTGADVRRSGTDLGITVHTDCPSRGAHPETVVSGFLQAQEEPSTADVETSPRCFLAAAARQSWRPQTGITVYTADGGPTPVTLSAPTRPSAASVTLTQVGFVDGQGHYQAVARRRLPVRFGLVTERGQWRISSLADGLLLDQDGLSRAFQPENIYFLDPKKDVLVPDVQLVPRLGTLATSLTTRLLRGPSRWLAPGVTTGFPNGSRLSPPSVPVVNGVARVDLDTAAGNAGQGDKETMAAQLVWTLKQDPQVGFVQITSDDQPFGLGGAAAREPRTAWPNYDPDGLPAAPATAYAVQAGRLGVLTAKFTPVRGPLGDGRQVLGRPAVSLTGGRVAGLSPDGHRLYAGLLSGGDPVPVVLSGGVLTPPSWDRTGALWTVDRSPVGGVVWTIPTGEKPRRVTVDLPDGAAPSRVTTVRVARDGARAAVVLRRSDVDQLYVGVVVRAGSGPKATVRILHLEPVAPDLTRVVDVVWGDAVSLAVLAHGRSDPLQPVILTLDGSDRPSSAPLPEARSLAAAPNQPLLAALSDGTVQQRAGTSWTLIGKGTDPAYPG